MTREEKTLASKIRKFFRATMTVPQIFTREEGLIVGRWIAVGFLSEKAFRDIPSFGGEYSPFSQIPTIYPFTQKGEEETTKGWYTLFREGKAIAILRDILTAIAFLVSLYLAITNLLPGNSQRARPEELAAPAPKAESGK